MKYLLILLTLLSLSGRAFAQEEPMVETGTSTVKAPGAAGASSFRREYILGLTYVQWNEKVNLQSGTLVDTDTANFVGTNLNIERNFSTPKWGWSLGASLGAGKASGGGNSNLITFQKGNQAWTSYGVFSRIYQKLSGRLSLGLIGTLIYRQVSWPSDATGFPVDSGKNINTGILFEVNFRLSRSVDFTQAIGPFSSSDGSTLWRIGLAYRL